MAWTYPIDPAVPGDNDLVSQGDNAIRELKAALLERFASIFVGWPDADPLVLDEAVLASLAATLATIKIDILANREAVPDTDFFYDLVEPALYVNRSGEWQKVASTGSGGTSTTRLSQMQHIVAIGDKVTGPIATATLGSDHISHAIVEDGILPSDYVVLESRIRAKTTAEASYGTEQVVGSGIGETDGILGADIEGLTPTGGAIGGSLKQQGIKVVQTAANTLTYHVGYSIYNNSGGSLSFDVESTLTLLRVT